MLQLLADGHYGTRGRSGHPWHRREKVAEKKEFANIHLSPRHAAGASRVKSAFLCSQSGVNRVLLRCTRQLCYLLGNDSVTSSRYFWSITLLLLCHPQMHAQLLTNALPGTVTSTNPEAEVRGSVPDDPSQQVLPVARVEPLPETGLPVKWEALKQTRVGDDWTLTGEVVLYYRDYVVRADKVVYHQSTETVEAEGNLQLEGGPSDANFTASRGEIHIQDHTAKFYDVIGSLGVRRVGNVRVYSTPDPFLFRGRMLLQTGENSYRIIDGSMTSCRLPKPDWELISHAINVANDKASTHNSIFRFQRVPLFYLPVVSHNLDDSGRESGFLLPAFENSGTKGLVLGEAYYWAINRSMDLTVGAEYWSKRGFAPNGDFRYKGRGLDALTVRWNGLLDRGVDETLAGRHHAYPGQSGRRRRGGVWAA